MTQPDAWRMIRRRAVAAGIHAHGPRVVYDSKTLNDRKSIGKNWQNMVNDLATEATTVHTRFPFCIVCFAVVLPRPALQSNQERALIRTLERLASRGDELDQNHLAEAISLVIWEPQEGSIHRGNAPAWIESSARHDARSHLPGLRGQIQEPAPT